MSVAVWSGSLVAWERELAALKARIGPVFGRAEVRATAGAFLDGLLSGGRAQNRLAPGRAGGAGSALPHAVALWGQPPGRRCAAPSPPRWRGRGPWRSGWRAGGRRDRVPEEGRALGRGRAPVFWHGGADRKL